jgi:putative membrane protein
VNAKLTLVIVALAAAVSTPVAFAAGQAGEHFIKEAIQGNLAEVKVGGLAEEKGASQGVKDFGAMLAKDHATANEKAKQAAQSLGVTPPDEPGVKQKTVYQELSALSGKEFDQHFIKDMVKDHKEDVQKYEKEANGSGPAASYAKEVLPHLRKHLETAEHLQQQLRTASAADSTKMQPH